MFKSVHSFPTKCLTSQTFNAERWSSTDSIYLTMLDVNIAITYERLVNGHTILKLGGNVAPQ